MADFVGSSHDEMRIRCRPCRALVGGLKEVDELVFAPDSFSGVNDAGQRVTVGAGGSENG